MTDEVSTLPLLDGQGLRCGWIPGRFHFPRHSLTLIAKGTYDLQPDGPATPVEEPDDLEGDVVDAETGSPRYDSDLAYWKPRADLLLVGACHPPGGQAARSDVSFRVGAFQKRLRVTGDRRWWIPFGPFSPKSRPETFERLDLGWANAAGGGRSKRNPTGKGRARTRDDAGRLRRDAPNLQAERGALLSPWWQGRPAGFGPLGRTWKPRSQRLGTYRRKWRKQRFPWFPENFDYAHFNAAPVDQRVAYLRGDEEVELRNLHPDHEVLRTALPGVRVRCFLNLRNEAEETFLQEVPLVLDTLWIDSEQAKLVLVWRGLADIATPEHTEVESAFFCDERLEAPSEDAEIEERYRLARAAQVGDTALEVEEEDADLAALEAVKAAGLEQLAVLKGELSDALEAAGLPRDYMDQPPIPREERLAALIERVKQQVGPEHLEDVVFPTVQQLEAQEAAALAYAGIEFPEIRTPTEWTAEQVTAKVEAGETLEGEALQELDLAGAHLAEGRFDQADLQGARLAGADLQQASFEGARLVGADLAGARLAGANLRGADLTGARLGEADLRGACLEETILDGADLQQATLSEVAGEAASFVGARLSQAQLEGAAFPASDFSDAELGGANFAASNLSEALLEGAQGEAAVFDEANLTKLHAGARCVFPGASFVRVSAAESSFEGAVLHGARFPGATLEHADFSGADLLEAELVRCQMPGARFDRAQLVRAQLNESNLFRGSFERANLHAADLRGANLYEVETLDADLEDAQLQGANLRMTKLA
ncbi:MAG: DUF2169 domain-containing protein [Myxococcota bacterium]